MGLNPADQVESFGEVYRLLSSRGVSAVSSPVFRNFARNSPATRSKPEIASLELQRFKAVSKSYRIKLRAELRLGAWIGCFRRADAIAARDDRWAVVAARPLYGLGSPCNRCYTNVRDQPDASRGRTLITSRRLEVSPQMGRNAWSMWRCCAASTSAATTRSS